MRGYIPLILDRLYSESTWWYLCHPHGGETADDSFRRVYHTLIDSVLHHLGHPDTVAIYRKHSDHLRLEDLPGSKSEQAAYLHDVLPDDTTHDVTFYMRLDLRTPSGHPAHAGVARVSIDPDDRGLVVRVSMDGVLYRPPGPDATPDEIRQYEYNGPKLTRFLQTLQAELNAELVGRDHEGIGPDGYLPPGADQTSLPSP